MFKKLKRKVTIVVFVSFLVTCNFYATASAQEANEDAVSTIEQHSVEKSPEAKTKEAPEPVIKSIKKVCLIVAPGLSIDSVNRYTLPNIGKFSRAGILSKGTVSSNPSSLDIDLANLFSGNEPEYHRYRKLNDKFKSSSLFTELGKFGKESVVIDGSAHMQPLSFGAKLKTVRTSWSSKKLGNLFDQYIDFLSNDRYFANVLVLPDISSKDTNQQYQNQQEFDRQFARIISSLVNQGIYDQTSVVVVGVHGKRVQSKDFEYPLVLSGPQLITEAKAPMVKICDVTPTLLYLATNKEPECTGLVLWDLLDTRDQKQQEKYYLRRIDELSYRAYDEFDRNLKLYQEIESFKWEKMRIHDKQKLAQNAITEKQEHIDKLQLTVNMFKFGGALGLLLALVGYVVEYFILRKRYLMF